MNTITELKALSLSFSDCYTALFSFLLKYYLHRFLL